MSAVFPKGGDPSHVIRRRPIDLHILSAISCVTQAMEHASATWYAVRVGHWADV